MGKGALLASAVMLGLAAGPAPASGDTTLSAAVTGDLAWLKAARATAAKVLLSNRVEDECWPDPQAAVQAVTDELQASGVAVADAGFGMAAQLDASGFVILLEDCVVAFTVDVFVREDQQIAHDGLRLESSHVRAVWQYSGVLTDRRADVSATLAGQFAGAMRDFLLERQRRPAAILREIGEKAPADHLGVWQGYLADERP